MRAERGLEALDEGRASAEQLKLFQIMRTAGYDEALVRAIESLLKDTDVIFNGTRIKTERGTP